MRLHRVIDSPVGELTLAGGSDGDGDNTTDSSRNGGIDGNRDGSGGALSGVYFAEHVRRPAEELFGPRDQDAFAAAAEQLGQYFAGVRRSFELALQPIGNAFQHKVWAQLINIPYGQTRTYGQLADALGGPGLARAVGAANGQNPLSIIVPCHRVVGSDGRLTGYAGGLQRKAFLLDLETPAAVRSPRLF